MDAAQAIRALIGDARLMDAASDRELNQLLVPLAPRAAAIDLRILVPVLVEAIGVDTRESADAAACRPSARAFAVRHGNALAALDEWQHFASRHQHGVERR